MQQSEQQQTEETTSAAPVHSVKSSNLQSLNCQFYGSPECEKCFFSGDQFYDLNYFSPVFMICDLTDKKNKNKKNCQDNLSNPVFFQSVKTCGKKTFHWEKTSCFITKPSENTVFRRKKNIMF